MRIDILTLFPDMFAAAFGEIILKRAQEKKLVKVHVHNIREWADNKHRKVDDSPYGGGPGMVMKVDICHKALEAVRAKASPKKKGVRVIYLSPQGPTLTQAKVRELLECKRLVLFCGHYEGVDERFLDYVDEEISVGDYVLTGGELPAMVLSDAVIRLIPGVLGDLDSTVHESFEQPMFDHPHYTRPKEYDGKAVPEVLAGGHAAKIAAWRKEQALAKTKRVRPDLLERKPAC